MSEAKVSRYLGRIGLRKATGLDGISSQILQLTKPVIVQPITTFLNRMIKECNFPDQLKCARVSPIFKKKDPLDVQHYRPVSILLTVSKSLKDHLKSNSVNILIRFITHTCLLCEKVTVMGDRLS